jgi:hypothetical protein
MEADIKAALASDVGKTRAVDEIESNANEPEPAKSNTDSVDSRASDPTKSAA